MGWAFQYVINMNEQIAVERESKYNTNKWFQ